MPDFTNKYFGDFEELLRVIWSKSSITQFNTYVSILSSVLSTNRNIVIRNFTDIKGRIRGNRRSRYV